MFRPESRVSESSGAKDGCQLALLLPDGSFSILLLHASSVLVHPMSCDASSCTGRPLLRRASECILRATAACSVGRRPCPLAHRTLSKSWPTLRVLSSFRPEAAGWTSPARLRLDTPNVRAAGDVYCQLDLASTPQARSQLPAPLDGPVARQAARGLYQGHSRPALQP